MATAVVAVDEKRLQRAVYFPFVFTWPACERLILYLAAATAAAQVAARPRLIAAAAAAAAHLHENEGL